MEMKRFEKLSDMEAFLKLYSISECIVMIDPSLSSSKPYIVFIDRIKTIPEYEKPITCPSCKKITEGGNAKFCQWCGQNL